ncbi:MAG: ABC transporter permease [Gemmatimonadetes bacterium]|nr:ABC transporter permease [Gemmatimonadota bacterium]
MLHNYLIIALRNLLRYPAYTLMNIVGLAIGLAACMLILLYVWDELSYDRYHPHADRVYRVIDDIESAGQTVRTAGSPSGWGPALKRDFPEIELFARVRGTTSAWFIMHEEQRFYEKRVIWADAALLDMFAIPFVAGNPRIALTEPYSIVISEEMAFKYFGDDEPMGKVLRGDNVWDFTVTGVMRNIPANSHLRPDMIISLITRDAIYPNSLDEWEMHEKRYTYIRLHEYASSDDLEAQLPAFVERNKSGRFRESTKVLRPSLQPLVDIHLHSHRDSEIEPNGDFRYVVLFLIIAFLIPLTACINFVNLATARAAMRAREVGVRKVMGANRSQLLGQFLGEAVVMAGLAMIVAVAVAHLALPGVNVLAGKHLDFALSNGWVLGALGAGTILIAVAAGSYPAVYLSGFLPTEVLKGSLKSGTHGLGLRQVLVVIQFVMSIFLLVSTAVIYDQLEYIQNMRLGFNKEHVMVVPITGQVQRESTPVLKQRLAQLPGVVGMATTDGVPGVNAPRIMAVRSDRMSPEDNLIVSVFASNDQYLDIMEIGLAAGRNFPVEWGMDSTMVILLNETAAQKLGWKAPPDAIGMPVEWIEYGGLQGRVLGVMADFHLQSIREEIEPIVFVHDPNYFTYILIRIRPEDVSDTIARIREVWRDVDPVYPLSYTFLDDDFNSLYRAEHQLGTVFAVFAFLAIFVACLGLLGLSSFSIQQRTREIGIRKVLGATIPEIVLLFSKDFVKYVLLANVIAWPLAYFAMTRWLQNYAYASEIEFMWFIAGGVVALIIAWLTIGAHAVSASRKNPVNALSQGC